VTSSLSADIATFYNNYSNLRTAQPGAPFIEGSPAPTDIVVPFVASNKMSGGTYGAELFADWRVAPKWRLVGSYSYLQMDIRKNSDSLDPTPDSTNGSSPRHQWYLRSSIDLPKHFEHDTTLRFVDHLPSLSIPSYYSLDAHLGWRPVSRVEFSIGGQNLLNNQHLEFIPDFINTAPTEVKRTVYGSMTLNGTSTADAQSGDTDSSEYLIKAGFIYNFAKFVEWPSGAFSQADSPIVIGVLGTEPFGNVLDRIVEDKKIGPRGFVVRRYKWGKDLKDLKDCKILFVSASERADIDEILQSVKGLPILTVGETGGFAE